MKIKKSTILWIVIAVMFLLVLWMTFSVGDTTGAVTQGVATSKAVASSSGMVGGC